VIILMLVTRPFDKVRSSFCPCLVGEPIFPGGVPPSNPPLRREVAVRSPVACNGLTRWRRFQLFDRMYVPTGKPAGVASSEFNYNEGIAAKLCSWSCLGRCTLCAGVGKVPAECGGVVALFHAEVGERQGVRCFLVELKPLGQHIGGRSVEGPRGLR